MELRAKREEEERKRREEKRRQQQQQQEEQKRRQEEEELFRRKQVGPGLRRLGVRVRGWPSQRLLSLGAAAGAVAEAAAAATGGSHCPRASCAQFPAPAVGRPGQAGPVHEDAAGAAAGGRAAPAQAAPASGAIAGSGPQPPRGEQACGHLLLSSQGDRGGAGGLRTGPCRTPEALSAVRPSPHPAFAT